MYDVTIKWTQSKCTSLQIKNEAVTSMFSSTILYSIDVKKKEKKALKIIVSCGIKYQSVGFSLLWNIVFLIPYLIRNCVVLMALPKESMAFQVNDLIFEILLLQILNCLVAVIIKWVL